MSEAGSLKKFELKELELFGKAYKVMSAEKVPSKVGAKSAPVLRFCQNIPRNGAVAVAADELGLTVASLYIMVNRFKKRGELPKGFYATTRTVDGVKTIYLVNSAKSTE